MRIPRLVTFAVFLAALWAWLPAHSAEGNAAVIEQAQVAITVAGREKPAAAATLPFAWDEREGAVEGQARFTMALPAAAPGPQSLYIPRMGNTYRVVFNGQELARFGELPADPYVDTTQQPQLIDVPDALLQPSNVLEITVGASIARRAGLSPVVFGPRDELHRQYAANRLWQVSGSRVVAAVSGVLGVLALVVWLRRRDRMFLYYGLGEVAWSVQTMRVLTEATPVPWPWSGIVVTSAFHAAPALLCKFALAVVGREKGLAGRAMDVLVVLAVPAAVAWLAFGVLWIGPAFQLASLLAGLAMAVIVVRATWGSKLLEERVLCAAVLLIIACAIRDNAVLRLSRHAFDVVPWVRFAWVGFAMSMAWVIAERLRKDGLAVAQLNDSVLAERQRLVRDLHDGLGSHLVTALVSAQKGRATAQDLTRELSEAVDRLRITVDAMHEAEGDITAALAAVRHRLGPRLQAAGVELHWDVEPLPAAPGWGVREAHHLQMLLYEAFGNVVAHSRASHARLAARPHGADGKHVHIELSDDGTGFDADSARQRGGKGLANMQARAAALRGRLDLDSKPGGTRLALVIPLG